MNRFLRIIVGVLCLVTGCTGCRGQSYSSGHPSYVIFDKSGNKVSYARMLKSVAGSDVCLFGEMHNDPISHWLELSLEKDLHALKGEHLVVGAEMWETDNQQVLDEFLKQGLIDESTYEENSRLWPNFSDYKPIMNYADQNGIRFVATNVPRRYARMVSDFGVEILDSLDAGALKWIAPMPVAVDYNEIIYAYIGESFKQMGSAPMMKKSVQNIVAAQALKDATMAYQISSAMNPGDYFFHFHGELHSAFHSGIAYYLKQYAPKLKVSTISVLQSDAPLKEKINKERADFTVVVPSDMTKTYEE